MSNKTVITKTTDICEMILNQRPEKREIQLKQKKRVVFQSF